MRELSKDEIITSARGLVDVREVPQGLDLRRFPDSAMSFYKSADHYRQCSQCQSGVRLDAFTDSATLKLATEIRLIYPLSLCIDLYVDGVFHGFLRTSDSMEMRYPVGERFDGELRWEKTNRRRRVTLYFPHLASLYLRSIQIDDGAVWEPVPEEPILLALGDSNTQGGTSTSPSLVYSSVAARTLGMSVHNRGIGGMVFDVGSLPERPLVQQPKLITVAYGTNDWTGSRDIATAAVYLRRLRELYPTVPTVVLAPIFRKTNADPELAPNKLGQTFADYRTALANVVRKIDGLHFIAAQDLLPPDPGLLFDGVHPSTAGHICYGLNLAAGLKQMNR